MKVWTGIGLVPQTPHARLQLISAHICHRVIWSRCTVQDDLQLCDAGWRGHHVRLRALHDPQSLINSTPGPFRRTRCQELSLARCSEAILLPAPFAEGPKNMAKTTADDFRAANQHDDLGCNLTNRPKQDTMGPRSKGCAESLRATTKIAM